MESVGVGVAAAEQWSGGGIARLTLSLPKELEGFVGHLLHLGADKRPGDNLGADSLRG